MCFGNYLFVFPLCKLNSDTLGRVITCLAAVLLRPLKEDSPRTETFILHFLKKDETTYKCSASLCALTISQQSVTREILQGLVKMSASVQTNLQSCQKAGSTQELPTNYLPETAALERDIPGFCLTSLGLTYCFRVVLYTYFV